MVNDRAMLFYHKKVGWLEHRKGKLGEEDLSIKRLHVLTVPTGKLV